MQTDPSFLADSAEEGKQILRESHPDLAGEDLEKSLKERFDEWIVKTHDTIDARDPFLEESRSLDNCREDYERRTTTKESLMEDVRNCGGIADVSKEQWISRIASADDSTLRSIQKELIGIWSDSLDRRGTEWALSFIELKRSQFIESMETWLLFIESARNAMSAMGLDTGVLWDLSDSEGFYDDLSELNRWSKAFGDDPNLRKLCELLGRSIIFSRSVNTTRLVPLSSRASTTDLSQKEELSGIELGNRIEDLLPSELGLMGDSDLSTLFDLKYIEGRLMCFTKQGYATVETETMEETEVSEEEEHAGPLIVCLDTSGSMTGTPEYLAKGVAFYLAMNAVVEKRRIYLINFSTRIECLDLGPEDGFEKLQKFLSFSFHGGTDIIPALEESVRMLDTEEYRLADVLAISDFVIPPDMFNAYREEIQTAKERKCRFHSLTIGNFAFSPDLPEVFDRGWKYDPATNTVLECGTEKVKSAGPGPR